MASIEKRRTNDGATSYRVKVRLNGHPPETATFERLTDAREWAKKIESDIKAGRHFGQSKRHTFNQLVDEYQPHAKDTARLDYWRKVFGPDQLDAITPRALPSSGTSCSPRRLAYLRHRRPAMPSTMRSGPRQSAVVPTGLRPWAWCRSLSFVAPLRGPSVLPVGLELRRFNQPEETDDRRQDGTGAVA